MPSLETTLAIANRAYYGRLDRAGEPYILHPIRVMLKQTSLEGRQTALLHDIIEDGHLRMDDLENYGFSAEVLAAVGAITRYPGEAYLRQYIERVACNQLATAVKIDDLIDNMDLTRFKTRAPDGDMVDLIRDRYEPALKRLLYGIVPEPLVQINGVR